MICETSCFIIIVQHQCHCFETGPFIHNSIICLQCNATEMSPVSSLLWEQILREEDEDHLYLTMHSFTLPDLCDASLRNCQMFTQQFLLDLLKGAVKMTSSVLSNTHTCTVCRCMRAFVLATFITSPLLTSFHATLNIVHTHINDGVLFFLLG